jgi:hypothetical protein
MDTWDAHIHTCIHASTLAYIQVHDHMIHVMHTSCMDTFDAYTHLGHRLYTHVCETKTILIPNAENKDQSGALWLQNSNLNFFFREKKRQSLWKSEYVK